MQQDIKDLPEHVSVFIDVENFDLLRTDLGKEGFRYTPLQIINPGQIYAKIMPTTFNGDDVELHVRCYHDGKLEAEYEPKRLGNIVQHLSRRSYSAHEYLIKHLTILGIGFQVDQQLRERYNATFPMDFPKQRFKFFHWLFISCLFIFPLGVIWRTQWEIKRKWKSMTETKESKVTNIPISGD